MAARALDTASPLSATGPSTGQSSKVPSLSLSSFATIGSPSGVTLACSPALPQGNGFAGAVVLVVVVAVAPGTVVSVDPGGAVVAVSLVDVGC